MLAAVDWHILWQRIFHPDHVFVLALWRTSYISVCAQVLGVVLGLIGALMRMSRLLPLRLLSGLYVLVFRGTPLIVQIFFVYFGANLLFGVALIPRTVHFGLFDMDGAAFAGIIALGLNEGAYMREIIRAGIDAVDQGQLEAARSLRMPYRLAMRRIRLPRASAAPSSAFANGSLPPGCRPACGSGGRRELQRPDHVRLRRRQAVRPARGTERRFARRACGGGRLHHRPLRLGEDHVHPVHQ